MSKTTIPTGGITADAIDATLIADDAISEEHLDATAITGHTALAATPADTDELLISDAGTIKRIDYSYLKSTSGLVPITTQAFGTGTLQINNCFSSTYVNYMMVITMLNMASDGHVEYRFGVGGSIDSASKYSSTLQGLQNNGSDTISYSDGDTNEGRLFYNVDADSEAGASGVFYIHSPQAAYQRKHIHGNSVNQNQTAGNTSSYQVASSYHNTTTQQFTDISIFTSGGQNFRAGSTSGGYSRIAIYGITNS
jgi:hypothetical protein